LPKSVEEALEINRTTSTDFWRKAINKEMSCVKIAWKTDDGHTLQQVWEGKIPKFTGFQEMDAVSCSI
jgi:hypothetical protein